MFSAYLMMNLKVVEVGNEYMYASSALDIFVQNTFYFSAGVGRTGWHIDGTFKPAPYPFSLYHMVSVPTKGATNFIPLTEVIENLEPEKRAKWDQLWMKSDREPAYVHPLIYKHPVTRKLVSESNLFISFTRKLTYSSFTCNQKLRWNRKVDFEFCQPLIKFC